MRGGRALGAALAAALLCVASAPLGRAVREPRAREPLLVGGIQVNEPDHRAWTGALRSAGLNTVAATVYAHQGDWDSDTLWWAEDDPAVLSEIRSARAQGLEVVLILRVALDHAFERNRFLWHGQIMPRDDATLDSWFDRYGAFVEQWAALAEREGVTMLGIGSEMKALSATLPISRAGAFANHHGFLWYQRRMRARTLRHADEIRRRDLHVPGSEGYDSLEAFVDDRYDAAARWAGQAYLASEPDTLARLNARRRRIDGHWRGLVDRVRGRFSGRLTYAANFDNYMNVGFWDRLDAMGVNAYFPLRAGAELPASLAAEEASYRDGWWSVFDGIASFQRSHALRGMPVVFTELGYTSRRHTTIEPWSHDGFSVVGWRGRPRHMIVWRDQPERPEERRLALAALDEVRRQRDDVAFAGLLYWKLSTRPEHEAIEPFVVVLGADPADERALGRFTR